MKGQGIDALRMGRVEVHVLAIPVRLEEERSDLARGQRGQAAFIDGEAKAVAGTKHHEFIVARRQKLTDFPVARVGARKNLEGRRWPKIAMDVEGRHAP